MVYSPQTACKERVRVLERKLPNETSYQKKRDRYPSFRSHFSIVILCPLQVTSIFKISPRIITLESNIKAVRIKGMVTI